MNFENEEMKGILAILISIVALISSFYAFVKWILPFAKYEYERQIHFRNEGYMLSKNMVRHFGKDAGESLRNLLASKNYEILLNSARLDELENETGIGVYVCNGDGVCTYANKTLSDLFGIEQEQMKGFGWAKGIIDQQKAVNNWNFAIKNNLPYSDTYSIRVDDKIKNVYTEARKLKDNEAGIQGYIGIVKEVK